MNTGAKSLELWCAETLSKDLLRLLNTGRLADIAVTQQGQQHTIGLHKCVLIARLAEGPLLRFLIGQATASGEACRNKPDTDGSLPEAPEQKTIILDEGVNWKAFAGWVEGIYSGTFPDAFPGIECSSGELQECSTTKSSRVKIGTEILRLNLDENETDTSSQASDDTVQSAHSQEILSPKSVPPHLAALQRDIGDLMTLPPQASASDMKLNFSHGRSKKTMHAHKCILATRSEFFNAMLDTGLIAGDAGEVFESEMNVDCPLERVEDVFGYLYTGNVSVRYDAVAHLLLMADVWCLDGLRGAVLQILRNRVCRKFRKPEGSGAKDVIPRVVQVLQLCSAALHYGLPDADNALYELRKDCVTWLGRHSAKCWRTREFAQLTLATQNEIRESLVQGLTPQALIQTFLDCSRLRAALTGMPQMKSVGVQCTQLWSELGDYLIDNFGEISEDKAFHELMAGGWTSESVDEMRDLITEKIDPESAIDVVQALNKLSQDLADDEDNDDSPQFRDMAHIKSLTSHVRDFALRHLMWIMRSEKYNSLDEAAKKSFVDSVQQPEESPRTAPHSGTPQHRKTSSVFIVFDGNNFGPPNKSLKPCPLTRSRRNTGQLHRRCQSACSMDPTEENKAIKKSESVGLSGKGSIGDGGGMPWSRGSNPRSSSRNSMVGDERVLGGRGSIGTGSWGQGGEAGRNLRRKNNRRDSRIPRPPAIDIFSGLSHFGSSQIPRPPHTQ